MIKQHGLDPIIQPSDVSETLPFPMEPQIAVMYLALKRRSTQETSEKSSLGQIRSILFFAEKKVNHHTFSQLIPLSFL